MSETGEIPRAGGPERTTSHTGLQRTGRAHAVSDPAQETRKARMREDEVRVSLQKLKDWWWSQHYSGKEVSLAAIRRTGCYTSAVHSLSELPTTRVPEPEVQKTVVQILEEANRDVIKALKEIDKTCQLHIIRHERALELFKQLSEQEFLRSNATQQAYRTQCKVIKANTQILLALRQKLRRSVTKLEQANASSGRESRTDRRIKELGRAAKEASRAMKAVGTQLGDVTSSTSAGLAAVKVDIYKQALRAYASQHRDKRLDTLKKVDHLSGVISKNTLVLAPIGVSWLNSMVEAVRVTALYGAREVIIEQARTEEEQSQFFGEVFAEFTKDPLLMANALAQQSEQNIRLLMAWLGVPAGAVGGGLVWEVMSKVVREVCYAYFDRRVKIASNTIKGIPSEKDFTKKVGQTLKELAEGVEKELTKQLTEEGTVAKIAKSYAKGTVSEGFAAELASNIVRPVVDLVLQCLPLTPAQVVTGDRLTDWTAATETVMGIPPRFLYRPRPTAEGKRAPRRPIPNSRLWDYSETTERYDWTLVESDEGQSTVSSHMECQRVCFESNRFGFRVWADGVGSRAKGSDIVWRSVDLVRLEAMECPGWWERTITGEGYTVGHPARTVPGTWARLPLPNIYAFIPASGRNPEFVRGITRTRLGTVDAILSSVRGRKLPFWDLGPNPPGYKGPTEPSSADRGTRERKQLLPEKKQSLPEKPGPADRRTRKGIKPAPPPGEKPKQQGRPEKKQSLTSSRPPLKVGDTCRYDLKVTMVDTRRGPDSSGRQHVQFGVGPGDSMRVWGWTADIDSEVFLDGPDESSLDDSVWARRTVTADGYRQGGRSIRGLAWRNPFWAPGYLALTALGGQVRALLRDTARTASGLTVKEALEALDVEIYTTPLKGG